MLPVPLSTQHNRKASSISKATPLFLSHLTSMCAIIFSTFPSCGHRRKTHRSEPCASYSPSQKRCNGTISVLNTITLGPPALCVRCASRIEAKIVHERDLIIAELKTNIKEINHRLWAERDFPFTYVALIFERARLREALETLWEDNEEELLELGEMQGIGRWYQVDHLRNNETWIK